MNLSNSDLSNSDLSNSDLSNRDLSNRDLSNSDLSNSDLSNSDLLNSDLSKANLSKANLSKANLSEANLSEANLSEANLTKANLTKADLTEADLAESNLIEVNLTGANLTEVDLTSANLTGANLTEVDLTGANLIEVNLSNSNLTSADLSGAILTKSNLVGANLNFTSLEGAELDEINLYGSNLTGSYLTETVLTRTNLTEANLSYTDMSSVTFNLTILTRANLSEVDLSGVDLSGANLSGANLSGANLSGADLNGTNLSGADLNGTNLSNTILEENENEKMENEEMEIEEMENEEMKNEEIYYNPHLTALENSTKILVQSPEEFLRSFSVTDFRDIELINWLKNFEIPANQIGARSALGAVYNIPGENYILKISNICPPNRSVLLDQLCNMAQNGDFIYRIPNTSDNTILVLAPNYILESIIGILLNKLSKYTSSFMKMYGFQYDYKNSLKPAYNLSEKLTNINTFITSSKSYLYFIFQIIHGLHVGQKIGKFVHYDLHQDNVMGRSHNNSKVYIYEIGNGKYLYTYFNFDAVIIDYGHNRYQVDDVVLSPRMNFFIQSINREILDRYEFNPYYDIFSLIYTNGLKANNGGFTSWIESRQIISNITTILFKMMAKEPSNTDLNQFIVDWSSYVRLSRDAWRPYPERLSTEIKVGSELWKRMSTTEEMMVEILDLINKSLEPLLKPLSPANILEYLNKNKFFISDQIIKPTEDTIVYYGIPNKNQLDTTYYNYKNLPTDKFGPINIIFHYPQNPILNIRNTYILENYTRPNINADQQYIHIANINVNKGIEDGYKFHFDCCHLDIRNYLQNKEIKSGIAVNASFFSIKDNYSPIGYFRTSDFFSKNPIPEEYKLYYGIVGVNENGFLNIDTSDNYNKYNQVMTVGPILMKNGVVLITDKTLKTDKKLQCQQGQNSSDKILPNGIPNCNKINPGELSHSSNPNPRTALGIRSDNTVILFHVEGRANRGAGMDMAQLAELCRSQGVVDAINLDGGRSSQVMWRKPAENVIIEAGPTIDAAYPVGSILSFIKK